MAKKNERGGKISKNILVKKESELNTKWREIEREAFRGFARPAIPLIAIFMSFMFAFALIARRSTIQNGQNGLNIQLHPAVEKGKTPVLNPQSPKMLTFIFSLFILTR